MKKIYLTLLLALLTTLGAQADEYAIIEGICYYLYGDEATVTSNSPKYSGSITIPSTVTYNSKTYWVTTIGSRAFNRCTGLTSITIPNSVTSIEREAFIRCTGLTSLTIPNSVTSIGSLAFYSCTGLTSITVQNGNSKYDSRDNCNAIIETATNTLVYGCKDTTIPNSVTDIGIDAFSGCTGLTSVTIPNSVTSIGDGAFSGCTGLTSVTIPNSVTSISNYAFEHTGLTSITIPNSVTSIGEYAFRSCTGFTSFTIPNSVTTIGDYAFSRCTGLTSVTIGNSVTSIGNDAFEDCSNLIKVITPDITAWLNISFGMGSSNPLCCAHHLYSDENTEITSLIIPDGVAKINSRAFSNCTGLTSVTIGNSVTTIAATAFSNCTGLISVTVQSGNTKYDSRDNCNAIIETATNTLVCGFMNTTIPNNVTTIGIEAFSGWTSLTSVTIPNSVTSISDGAFWDCTSLTSIVIPNSVTTIDRNTFRNCTGLTSITIGCGVTTIGNFAFYGCSSLEKVITPDITAWLNISFGIGPSNPLYCAHHLYSDENTEITNLVVPGGMTKINPLAFHGCTGLTSITIPISVTSIGNEAFFGCTGLTSIIIPNSVISIGDAAFYGCTGLTSITIGSSVTMIDEEAFATCSNLKNVYCYAEAIPTTKVGVFNETPYGTLHVPASALEVYKATEPWSYFYEIVPLTDEEMSVGNHENENSKTKVIARYGINGQRISDSQRGLNILRMSDGTVRKVMQK